MAGLTPSSTWDPSTYLKFADFRARPAEDLIPRLHLDVPGPIYDLGCGPGNLTWKLRDRWPERATVGVDSSMEMLADAEQKYGTDAITWKHGDISAWRADEPAALIFANASLQWVGVHESLYPRLFSHVAGGGLFAVQVPMTADAPYQECIRQTIALPRWRNRLAGARPHGDVLSAEAYYELLWPHATGIDMWETYYHHILTGQDPVVAWMSGTGLVPFLSLLDEAERRDFLADYAEAARRRYPPQSDGKTIFTMRRLFLIAKRA